MEENKFSTLYRMQSNSQNELLYSHKSLPRKRVIISDVGKIVFNPNSKQHVYFSRTEKHHIYYIFNKVFKIVVEELNNNKHLSAYNKLNIPDDMKAYFFYREIDWNIIKRVQDFFRNYLPPISVELVSIQYLNSLSQLIEQSHTNNKRSKISLAPELSDTSFYGGAYGLSDAWLDLLRCSTISTKSTRLYLDKFFEFYVSKSSYRNSVRSSIRGILNHNPQFFELLENLTYCELKNPDFVEKNNANHIIDAVERIYGSGLYNQESGLTHEDFKTFKKNIRTEINEIKYEK